MSDPPGRVQKVVSAPMPRFPNRATIARRIRLWLPQAWLFAPFALLALILSAAAWVGYLAWQSQGAAPETSAAGKTETADESAQENNGDDRTKKPELTRPADFRKAYLEAKGGRSKLEKLRSVRVSGTFFTEGREVDFFTVKRRPDQSLTTLDFGDHRLSFGIDGRFVWQRIERPGEPPEYEKLTGPQAEALRQMSAFFDPVMRTFFMNEGTVETITKSSWHGQPSLRLKLVAPPGKTTSVAHVDPETLHLLARLRRMADGRRHRVVYGDFREVNGFWEPFLIETYIDDALQNRVRVQDMDHNVGVLPKIFDYPDSLRD